MRNSRLLKVTFKSKGKLMEVLFCSLCGLKALYSSAIITGGHEAVGYVTCSLVCVAGAGSGCSAQPGDGRWEDKLTKLSRLEKHRKHTFAALNFTQGHAHTQTGSVQAAWRKRSRVAGLRAPTSHLVNTAVITNTRVTESRCRALVAW